jgi:protein O-mannosyl-transferase
VFGILAIVAQRAEGSIPDVARFSLHERALVAMHSLLSYVIRGVAPFHLSAFHPYPVEHGGALPFEYYLAPVAVLLLAAAVAWSARWGRTVAFGMLFFVINLVLVLQLIPVGSAALAERYTYVPYAGLGLAIGGATLGLVRGAAAAGMARTVVRGLCGAFLLVLVLAARERSEVWRDSVRLWTNVIERYPTLPTAYTHRAWALQGQGDPDGAMKDLDRALALEPENEEALSTRGTIHLMRGDYPRARVDLDEALRLRPRSSAAWNNRGLVRLNQGDAEGAIEDFTRAIELGPRSTEGYLNRAVALGGEGRYRDAAADIDRAIEILPGNARAHLLRGVTRLALGDAAGAIADHDEALRVDPSMGEAYLARAQAYETLGRREEALRDAERARASGHSVPDEYLEKLRRSAATP